MNKKNKLAVIIASAAAALVVVGGVLAINLNSTHSGTNPKAGTTQTSGPDHNSGSSAPSATATTPAPSASSEPAADNSGDWASEVGSTTHIVKFTSGQMTATEGGYTVDCTKETPIVPGAEALGAAFNYGSAADKSAGKNATGGSCLWGGPAADEALNG